MKNICDKGDREERYLKQRPYSPMILFIGIEFENPITCTPRCSITFNPNLNSSYITHVTHYAIHFTWKRNKNPGESYDVWWQIYQARCLHTSICIRKATHMICNFLIVVVVANPSVEKPTSMFNLLLVASWKELIEVVDSIKTKPTNLNR